MKMGRGDYLIFFKEIMFGTLEEKCRIEAIDKKVLVSVE